MSGCRAGKGPPPDVRSPAPESVITKPESAFEIPDSVITITAPAIMIARTVPNTRNQMPGIRWVGMTTTIISTMIMINQKVRSRWTGAITRALPPNSHPVTSRQRLDYKPYQTDCAQCQHECVGCVALNHRPLGERRFGQRDLTRASAWAGACKPCARPSWGV